MIIYQIREPKASFRGEFRNPLHRVSRPGVDSLIGQTPDRGRRENPNRNLEKNRQKDIR